MPFITHDERRSARMTTYNSVLTVDFGHVGFWNDKQPFRVRLDAAPLAGLIRDAHEAHRVYELLLIDRPGDIWDYVWVVLDEVPTRVAERVARVRQNAPSIPVESPDSWPDDRIPLKVFDSLFRWAWDDTDPEDEAWLRHRHSALMQSFARQALLMVRAAKNGLHWSDPLLLHVMARVQSGDHPYCYMYRDAAREKDRELTPNRAQHTAAFYQKLGEVLRDANLALVAYRAHGDYRVLRMLATEQRRRASRTGHTPSHAMQVSALVDNKASNEAWESEIRFFEEGLGYGDLFIDGGGLGGSLKAVVETDYRAPGRFILATRDEGSIDGFDKESGDGWVLYTRQNPRLRRAGLERSEQLRFGKLGAVLSFAATGATIFDHEKAVVVVGADVPGAARAELAMVLAEWQRADGDLLVVVLGDSEPFDLAGCQGVVSAPADVSDEASWARWLTSVVQQALPWIDVVMALQAPEWARQALANRLKRQQEPWAAWVVATESDSLLKADQLLEGDLAQGLKEARLRSRDVRG
jgi:hypothetical protein